MMVRIVSRLDGGISMLHPAPKSWRKTDKLKIIKTIAGGKFVYKTVIVAKAETEIEWLERVFSKMTKDFGFEGRPYKDVDESEIPSDREFRNAWEFDNVTKTIKINNVKKQEMINKKAIAEKKDEILERQAKEELGIE